MGPRIIEASGSRYSIGWKIGRHCADLIHGDMQSSRPDNWSESQLRTFVSECWKALREEFPPLAEELRGMADGADVPLFELLLTVFEEVWDVSGTDMGRHGCTDIVAVPPATAPGTEIVLGHNNDSDPEKFGPDRVVLLFVAPDDGPDAMIVGFSGTSPMVGINSNGVTLGGNQLRHRDVRAGVPRIMLSRAVLNSRNVTEAETACLNKRRGGAYNFIIADGQGNAVDLEGSATDYGRFVPGKDGLMWHANHYTHRDVLYQEAYPAGLPESRYRAERAEHLLKANWGEIDKSVMAGILRDHAGFPDSLCWHNYEQGKMTVFSTIIEPNRRTLWLALGNPCGSRYRSYRL